MPQVAPDGAQDIELLKDEAGGLMWESGITTITFYKGDFQAAAQAVRAQFDLVVGSNPWLAGRLVKTKTGAAIRHPGSPDAADIEPLFAATGVEETAAFKLSPTTAYTETCTGMYASKAKIIVGSGKATLGKPEPLTLLTLSESATGEFALIFSMSHVIGDGRTYYDIFQMLQPGAAVRALSSARVMSFSEEMRDVCGRKELEWADSGTVMCMSMCAMMPCCHKPPKCFAFQLDAEKLAAAKEAGAKEDGVEYVSTNDILTSAFFSECGSRIGMMGMDCRGRIDGIEADMAGNYVTALTMDPDTFGTPGSVRKMLSSTPYKPTMQPLPTCGSWCCGSDKNSMAMVTNWSSFAGGMVQIEGCEMVVHLPVQNPAYCVFDVMIPFASGVGKTGVLIWTVNSDEDGLRHALPVGDNVSESLFPSEGA
jgi:hypothetical protein